MIEQRTGEFGALVDSLVTAGIPPDTDSLTKFAAALAKVFRVDADEVAVLGLNVKNKNLKFIIPEKLSAVGTIPLSSQTALAARTARERRPELQNNFGSSRHATVFEGVPLGRDRAETIQKIISAPILEGAGVRGVVQISRKGRSSLNAGPDFTQEDLRTLTKLSPPLVRFLKLCEPE